MSENDTAERGHDDASTGPLPRVEEDTQAVPQEESAPVRLSFPEVSEVPEAELPEPSGRTDFSGSEPAPHDVWGKVESPRPRPTSEPQAAPWPEAGPEPAPKAEPAYEPEPAFKPVYEADPAYAPEPEPAFKPEPAYAPEPEPVYEAEPAYAYESESKFEPVRPAAPVVQEQPLEQPVYEAEPQPAPEAAWAEAPAYPAEAPPAEAGPVAGGVAPEDIKVAPVPAEDAQAEGQAPGWEGSLFDGENEEGDPRYAAVTPTGAGIAAKPGKPSSGNWQMPDWMADEESADAKLGGSPRRGVGGDDDGSGGRGRLVMFGGVGLLVVAVLAAGGVYYMKNKDDTGPAPSEGKAGLPASARKQQPPQAQLPADRKLRRFAGKPSRVLARVPDAHSGLAYPRLGPPWQLPTKKNKLGTSGWSGQQVLVTEKRAAQPWYGQLLVGTLIPTLRSAYEGPDSVKNVAGLAAKGLEENYYAFPHRSAPLASQALTVGGRKGWLVASYLTYKRAGVRASGEVVATAVIDTGRPTPAVVFASMPNTHRKMWPDINQFFGQLKLAS